MNQEFSQSLDALTAEDLHLAFRAAADLAFNSVLLTDADHKILYANPAFCNMTGYSSRELVGNNPKMLQGPLTEPTVIHELRDALKSHQPFTGSTVNYHKNGRPYLVEWTISAVNDESGEPRFYVSVQKDVTQLHAAESTGNLFAKAIDAAYDGIFITNEEGIIEFANQGFEIITGYTPIEVIGRSPALLKSGRHDRTFYRGLWRHLNEGLPFRAMVINRHKDGHEIHCQQTITPVKNAKGRITHFISIIKDLTDRVFAELKLREQASHDSLTGLLNRRAGEIDLEVSLIQAQEESSPFCMLMLDIDDFKTINDTHGHSRGDEVIKAVADTLMDRTRKTDKCIRWGGEEFIVLLPFCGVDKAVEIADNLRQALSDVPFRDIGHVTVSVGVTESRADDTPAGMLDRADRIMYHAKRAGKNQVVSDQGVDH